MRINFYYDIAVTQFFIFFVSVAHDDIFLNIKLSIQGGPARQKDRVKSCAGAPVWLARGSCAGVQYFSLGNDLLYYIRRNNNNNNNTTIIYIQYNTYVCIPGARRETEFTRSRASLQRPWCAFAQSEALPTVETRE